MNRTTGDVISEAENGVRNAASEAVEKIVLTADEAAAKLQKYGGGMTWLRDLVHEHHLEHSYITFNLHFNALLDYVKPFAIRRVQAVNDMNLNYNSRSAWSDFAIREFKSIDACHDLKNLNYESIIPSFKNVAREMEQVLAAKNEFLEKVKNKFLQTSSRNSTDEVLKDALRESEKKMDRFIKSLVDDYKEGQTSLSNNSKLLLDDVASDMYRGVDKGSQAEKDAKAEAVEYLQAIFSRFIEAKKRIPDYQNFKVNKNQLTPNEIVLYEKIQSDVGAIKKEFEKTLLTTENKDKLLNELDYALSLQKSLDEYVSAGREAFEVLIKTDKMANVQKKLYEKLKPGLEDGSYGAKQLDILMFNLLRYKQVVGQLVSVNKLIRENPICLTDITQKPPD